MTAMKSMTLRERYLKMKAATKPAPTTEPPKPKRPYWTLKPRKVAEVRQRAPNWTVRESIGGCRVSCRECGTMIAAGEKRLTFILGGFRIDGTPREGHLHFEVCTKVEAAPVNGTPELSFDRPEAVR